MTLYSSHTTAVLNPTTGLMKKAYDGILVRTVRNFILLGYSLAEVCYHVQKCAKMLPCANVASDRVDRSLLTHQDQLFGTIISLSTAINNLSLFFSLILIYDQNMLKWIVLWHPYLTTILRGNLQKRQKKKKKKKKKKGGIVLFLLSFSRGTLFYLG